MTVSPSDEEHEMSLDHDEEIRPLLAAAVSDGPGTADLLAGVVRAQRRRRVLVPAMSLSTAGVLGAAAFTVFTFGGTPSAEAQIAAAVDASTGQSFHVHIVSGSGVYDGAFDPARRVGRMALPSGGVDLFVGDTEYLSTAEGKGKLPPGKQWISARRPTQADWDRLGPAVQLLKLGPQDPQLILDQLRSASGVKDLGAASGPGWTGHRYSYTVTSASGPAGKAFSASGTVSVDSHNLVREVVMRTSGGGRSVLTFGDYGTPVSVTAPPADQVTTKGPRS
jgi:hypothetical protein